MWHWAFMIPLAAIVIGPAAWIINDWMRVKHGYPPSDPNNGLGSDRKAELLASENEALKGQVSRLEERIAVLERIATDPGVRAAREIEALREEGR